MSDEKIMDCEVVFCEDGVDKINFFERGVVSLESLIKEHAEEGREVIIVDKYLTGLPDTIDDDFSFLDYPTKEIYRKRDAR